MADLVKNINPAEDQSQKTSPGTLPETTASTSKVIELDSLELPEGGREKYAQAEPTAVQSCFPEGTCITTVPGEMEKTLLAQMAPTDCSVLLIGENHSSAETRRLLKDNIPALKEQGFETLCLEISSDKQELLDKYSASPAEDLGLAVQIAEFDPGGGMGANMEFLDLIREAKSHGMHLVAADRGKSVWSETNSKRAHMAYDVVAGQEPNPELASEYYRLGILGRSAEMGEHIAEVQQQRGGKAVLLVGRNHISVDAEYRMDHPRHGELEPISLAGNGVENALEGKGLSTYTTAVHDKSVSSKDRKLLKPWQQAAQMTFGSSTQVVHAKGENITADLDAIIVLPKSRSK